MTTDSDSECSYVANLADFNVIIVIQIVYNSKKSSNSYSNNSNKIVYNSNKSNNCTNSNYYRNSNNYSKNSMVIIVK